uniref:DUF4386 domain-containing protein n=1 Tax=OCS116 cluster bacterium TaxID=2030921 RepID=A0A2A4Z864_9PROT
MIANKKLATITGVFFIVATVMGILSAGMVGPIIGGAEYLTEMATNANLVFISVISNFIMAGCVTAIAVSIYPILKQVNELKAISYLAARIFEGIILATAGLIWLVLVPLSQEFIDAGMPQNSHFTALGDVLVSLNTAGFTLGAYIVFGFTAVLLNDVLFRYKLVPKFISIWGFIGGALILVLGVLIIFDMATTSIEIAFTIPIALNEMVLAVWLIVKGFNTENLKGQHD